MAPAAPPGPRDNTPVLMNVSINYLASTFAYARIILYPEAGKYLEVSRTIFKVKTRSKVLRS